MPANICFLTAAPLTRPRNERGPWPGWHGARCRSLNVSTMTAAPAKPTETHAVLEAVAESTLPSAQVLRTPSHWRVPGFGVLIDTMFGNTGPKLARKYGPIYRSSHFSGDGVIISRHSATCVLQKNTRLLSSQHSMVAMEDLLGENSLVYLDGIQHAKLRSVYAPLFAPQTMARYYDIAYESAEAMLADISHHLTRSSSPVDVEPHTKRHFFRVGLAVIFRDVAVSSMLMKGFGSLTARDDPNDPSASSLPLDVFFNALDTVLQNMYLPKIPPLTQATERAMKALCQVVEPTLRDRLETDADIIDVLRSGSDQLVTAKTALLAKQMDFATLLAAQTSLPTKRDEKDDAPITKQQIAQASKPLVSLFIAGYLTTAPTFLSCIAHIFQNPTLVAQLEEEQRQIPELSLQAVNNQMPLLTSTLYETLRVSPVVTATSRVATEDLYIERHLVRKGEIVTMDIWAANRDPAVFNDPDTFNAHRFMPSADGKIMTPTSSVLTFGAPGNPHYCLGAVLAKMELKVTVSLLLRNYDVRVVKSNLGNFSAYPIFKPRKLEFEHCSPRTAPL